MSTAAEALRSRQYELIELLLSWGATSDPAVALLFDVMGGRREGGIGAQVERLLARADRIPNGELRETLTWVQEACSSGKGSSFDVRSRFRMATETMRIDLQRTLESRRSALQNELEPWLAILGPRRAEPILEDLWQTGGISELDQQFEALDALDRAEEQLEQARRELAVEVARIERTESNAAALEQADAALQSGKAEDFARAQASLHELLAEQQLDSKRSELATARKQLSEDLARLGKSASGPDGNSAAARRATELLEAARQIAGGGTESGEVEMESALRTVRACRSELQESAGIYSGDLETASTVRRELLQSLQQAHPEQQAALAELAPDAPGFYARLATHFDRVHGAQTTRVQQAANAAKPVRKTLRKLEEEMQSNVDVLDGETLVRARLAAQETRAALAADDVPRMEQSEQNATEALGKIAEAAQEARRERKDRHSALRESAAGRLEQLRPVVPRKIQSRLDALNDQLNQDPHGAIRELEQLEIAAGGDLRRRALVMAAHARSSGADDEASRLYEVLDGDSLAQISKVVDALANEPFEKRGRRKTMIYSAGAASGLALCIFAMWLWFSSADRPVTYQFAFAGSTDGSGQVRLLSGGKLFAEKPFGASLSFDLPPGYYEIYIDEQFTGRAVQVPDDPARVEAIPIPVGAETQP